MRSIVRRRQRGEVPAWAPELRNELPAQDTSSACRVIGIVVVSHSRALADAAVGLASEMVQGDRPEIRVAAGLDEQTFGTDAMAVADAITAADGPDGVLVLLDLGSAVLSAEMALELVDPEIHDRVRLSPAPLVEGLVAAVVLAAGGASLAEAAAEAGRGLVAKQEHLGVAVDQPETVAPAAEREVDLVVATPHGLHARPAARLVALARQYDAGLTITDLDTGRGPVEAGSLSMVATLNVQQGHRIRVGASGPQAEAALTAVTELAAQNFGDAPAGTGTPTPVGAPAGGPRAGSGLDVAIGPAIVPVTEVDLSGYAGGDAGTEAARSDAARARAIAALQAVRTETERRVGAQEAAIFDAHLALLGDPAVDREVRAAIDAGNSAPAAWTTQLDAVAAEFEGLGDAYQRERAQDVRAVRRRILEELAHPEAPTRAGNEPDHGILVVPELDAATAATTDTARVGGIATRAGGSTGHGVIVARSRGIPIVTGIGDVTVEPGQLVAFDGRSGRFVAGPDEAVQAEFRALAERRTAERDEAVRVAAEPAVTTDGHRVHVLANVGSVADARAAAALGAEGSGLVRTEVLFADRATAPGVEDQLEVFRQVAAALGGRPVTIRTWDVGGDKPLPFLPLPAEPNPFLGERGLRVFRHRPELLRDQLTAICELARTTPARVMFPMVTTAEEVGWARALLAGSDPPDGLEIGIMVEVPAAALNVEHLAAGLDFVSIGTNDLTQYVTAADRGNTAVSGLADGLDPAVLRLIRRVTEHVGEVAVCGDLASDPDAAVLLAGLGVGELSATAPQVPLVKARLRRVSRQDAAEAAGRALRLRSAEEVRRLLAGFE